MTEGFVARKVPALALTAALLAAGEYVLLAGNGFVWFPLLPVIAALVGVRVAGLTWRDLHVAQLLAALVCGFHHLALIPIAIAAGGAGLHLLALADPAAGERGGVGTVARGRVLLSALSVLVLLAACVAPFAPPGSGRSFGYAYVVFGAVGGLGISAAGAVTAAWGGVRPGTLVGAVGALVAVGAIAVWMACGAPWPP